MGFVAYWNSFRAGFLLDNRTIILQDPRLTAASWQNVRDIFTRHYWWPSLESHLYRPVTTLSYWLNFSVLGEGGDPFGYHALNLALHGINVTLAYVLVRSIAKRQAAALVAAALFAVHPLTVESVTNVVGRADLLAGLSVLGGLCVYRVFLRSAGWRRRAWLSILGLVYAVGVFCKESAVVLPGLMLLHDLAFPLERGPAAPGGVQRTVAHVWPAYLSVLPGLAALLWARWALFRHSPLFGEFASDNPIVIAPFWTGVMTAVKVAGYYLALIIWPAKLSSDYSYDAITLFGWTLTSGQDLHAWAAVAAVAAMAVWAAAAWRHNRAVWFFLGCAAVSFLPTSNLLFPIGTIMAERLMYLPLVGMTAAVVLTIAAAGERAAAAWSRRVRYAAATVLTIAAVVAISALTARTIARNEDWASDQRLWSASAEAAPRSIKVLRGLAAIAMESDPSGGRVDEAIEIVTRGLRILEEDPLPLAHMPAALFEDAGVYYSTRARLAAGRGAQGQARAAFEQALALLRRAEEIDLEINRQGQERLLKRGLDPAQIHDTGTPVIYRNLGSVYIESGDPERAIETLTYLRHIRPADPDSHYTLAMAEGAAAQRENGQGEPRAAREHLERAAVSLIEATLLDPRHGPSWQALERVYGLLAPSPAAVLIAGDGRALNQEHPLVPDHARQAGVQLVRQLADAGLREDAERWRRKLIEDGGIPRDLFRPARPER